MFRRQISLANRHDHGILLEVRYGTITPSLGVLKSYGAWKSGQGNEMAGFSFCVQNIE